MSRYDEWRRDREWRGRERHGSRDEGREERDQRGSFYPGNPGFEENAGSGRTAGGEDRQPYSQNPYGRYPGQQGRGGDEWHSAPPQRYGQREPYNSGRGGESRYGYGGGSQQPRREDAPSSRFDQGSAYGEGPFADTSESPRFFGTGNYGDGGASYAGGFDQRQGQRNYGSLYGSEPQPDRGGHQQSSYRSGPKGYTRSDERLREDISERLMLANGIDSSEVSVQVKEGKVTLEGTVPNRRMKHDIEDLADQCPGVQDVDNRIRVKREEWGTSASAESNTVTASGVTPTSGSSGTTSSGRGRKE